MKSGCAFLYKKCYQPQLILRRVSRTVEDVKINVLRDVSNTDETIMAKNDKAEMFPYRRKICTLLSFTCRQCVTHLSSISISRRSYCLIANKLLCNSLQEEVHFFGSIKDIFIAAVLDRCLPQKRFLNTKISFLNQCYSDFVMSLEHRTN